MGCCRHICISTYDGTVSERSSRQKNIGSNIFSVTLAAAAVSTSQYFFSQSVDIHRMKLIGWWEKKKQNNRKPKIRYIGSNFYLIQSFPLRAQADANYMCDAAQALQKNATHKKNLEKLLSSVIILTNLYVNQCKTILTFLPLYDQKMCMSSFRCKTLKVLQSMLILGHQCICTALK